jgi:peptidoglycan/xylan/chitin deacetylase (PgdA/CDA1 family)
MNFYWIKTNTFIKKIFSNYVWDIPNTENKIYLTFDDGPTPDVTEWVLEELKKHQAKATFFCIGKNIENNSDLFKKVITEGHAIGNHTYNHLNGWKTSTKEYIENCNQWSVVRQQKAESRKQTAEHRLQNTDCKLNTEHCLLFRPPYGKIKLSQSKKLQQLGFKIIMWDVISADFDQTISPEKCLENVLQNVVSGSIIVFHDSVKAYQNLKHALPKSLQILKERGFTFDTIQ